MTNVQRRDLGKAATTMNAFDAAGKNGRAMELQTELEALFSAQNRSGSQNATSIPATFLRVSVTV